jgi:hypothetical protein
MDARRRRGEQLLPLARPAGVAVGTPLARLAGEDGHGHPLACRRDHQEVQRDLISRDRAAATSAGGAGGAPGRAPGGGPLLLRRRRPGALLMLLLLLLLPGPAPGLLLVL